MIYRVVPFPMTFSDRWHRFQGQGVTIDALDVLCIQLMCDLFAIAKFLVLNFCLIWLNSRKCNTRKSALRDTAGRPAPDIVYNTFGTQTKWQTDPEHAAWRHVKLYPNVNVNVNLYSASSQEAPLMHSMCRVLIKKTPLQCTTKTVNLHVWLADSCSW